MSTAINTAAYVRSPLESSDFDGFDVLPTVPTFKALTDAQYERWAKLGGVSVEAVKQYHADTGKAPKKGFRSVHIAHEFPGLLQLHALNESELAGAEASYFRARAAAKVRDLEATLLRAKGELAIQELLEVSQQTTATVYELAYRRYAGIAK